MELVHCLMYRDKLTAKVGRYMATSETLCLCMGSGDEEQRRCAHIPVVFALIVWLKNTVAFITVFCTQHRCFESQYMPTAGNRYCKSYIVTHSKGSPLTTCVC
jgi:hypothetical protein